MKEYILSNWQSLLFLFIGLVYLGNLLLTKKWEQLRKIAYKAILAAEKEVTESGKGSLKFAFVVNIVMSAIPLWLHWLFTRELVSKKIQEYYNDVKDYLDDGLINNSTVNKDN